MPQMKPMNWLMLYFMLNMILFLINIMNYFFINNKLNKNLMMKKKNYLIWKW